MCAILGRPSSHLFSSLCYPRGRFTPVGVAHGERFPRLRHPWVVSRTTGAPIFLFFPFTHSGACFIEVLVSGCMDTQGLHFYDARPMPSFHLHSNESSLVCCNSSPPHSSQISVLFTGWPHPVALFDSSWRLAFADVTVMLYPAASGSGDCRPGGTAPFGACATGISLSTHDW